jgi:hypothetical protein
MVTPLSKHWNTLRQGKPGHRFRDRYRRNQRAAHRHNWAGRIVRICLAAVTFTIGVILAFIPGPAVVFFLLTGALLASDFFWMARLLDWGEVKGRKLWGRAERIWEGLPMAGRVALVLAGATVSVASSYGFYRLMQ